MKLYVNGKGEIQDVGTTTDTSLTEVIIDDEMVSGWSVAKICCYKIEAENGKEKTLTPYVNSNVIDKIDKLDKNNEANATDITDTQIGLTETYQKALETDATITDIQLALVELYEMILGGK